MLTKKKVDSAKARIENGWCKGAMAKDAYGLITDPMASNAARFCLMGAFLADGESIGTVEKALDKYTSIDVISWNDMPKRTKEDVLNLLDKVKKQCWL